LGVRVSFGCSLLLVSVLLATATACSPGGRQRREAQERYRRESTFDARQRDSAIEATREALRAELPRRQAQWAAHGITAYRLTIRVTCFCADQPPAVVTVRGDSILVRNSQGQPLTADQTQRFALSVPKLFEAIRRSVANPNWQVEASFDSKYGFPNFIHTYNRDLSDSGRETYVEAFKILSSQPSSPRLRQN
jgi:hypothetical protein